MRNATSLNKASRIVFLSACCLVFVVSSFSSQALAEVKKAANQAVRAPVPDTPLSYDSTTQTIIIAGACNTDEIYAYMHDGGVAVNATTLRFAGFPVIETRQYNPSGSASPDQNKGPFANTGLQRIIADANTRVSFIGSDAQTSPTLFAFFYKCAALASLDGLSSWDVSNVTGNYCMANMFQDCALLKTLDGLAAWDVSSVRGSYCMSSLFFRCTGLISLDALSAWDVSAVTGSRCMSSMFYKCSSLTSLDGLSNWNVSSVSSDFCMESMFDGCSDLTSLDGLASWNIHNVNGPYCMMNIFANCTKLASLDGISSWDVSNVHGIYCMAYMFRNCTKLASVDGLSAWNNSLACSSANGVIGFFYGCSALASITLGGPSGFLLSDDMNLLDTAYWWPVDVQNEPVAVNTETLIEESASAAPISLRWQMCTSGQDSPMLPADNPSVTWPLSSNLTYTGLLQTVAPTVYVDGVLLEEGRDYYVNYQISAAKQNGAVGSTTASHVAAVKDAGTYTAQVHLRGAYVPSESIAPQRILVSQLDLSRQTNPVSVFMLPSVYQYTGSACEPKTMVGLHVRDAMDSSLGEAIPVYTYLQQRTTTSTNGDFEVSYADNINPGNATVIVSPAVPGDLTSSNLEDTAEGSFRIMGDYVVTFDSNGGSEVESIDVLNGQTISEPAAPTKDGYYFIGWYKEDSFINIWDFETDTVNADITLFAKWTTTKTYTVTFDTQGGSFVEPQYIAAGSRVQLPTEPTKDDTHEHFAGWYKEAEGETLWNFETDTVEADTTIYAQWEDDIDPDPTPPDPTPPDPAPTPPSPTPTPIPIPVSEGGLLALAGDQKIMTMIWIIFVGACLLLWATLSRRFSFFEKS